MRYKKLENYKNEFGEDRGNCSGLIECCLKTKAYLTCNNRCIEIENFCENCKWAVVYEENKDYFFCHYNPPKTEAVWYGDKSGIWYFSQNYPIVFKDSFCSKFESKSKRY